MNNGKKYLIVDTETSGTLEDPFAYDIGFAVIDENANVYEAHSYAVAEIFLDKEMMNSAYYAEKVPTYWDEIKRGERQLKTLRNVRKAVWDTMRKYGIHEVIAHNMRFDNRSTNYTERLITGSKYRFFFPYGTVLLDTLKMSRDVFGRDEDYIKFCEDNGYMTAHSKPRPRLTAEILYRYITQDKDFCEVHKGLDDVMIEKEIFAECLRRNPEVNGRLW